MCVTVISALVRLCCQLRFNGYLQFQVQNALALSVVLLRLLSVNQSV